MQFYVLKKRGQTESSAVTEFSKHKPSLGEAARCTVCGRFISLLPWLPPYRAEKVSGLIISYFSLSFRSRYRKVPVPAIVESCLDCPAGDCGFRLRASADCAPTLSSLVFNSRSGDQKGVPDIDTDSAGG